MSTEQEVPPAHSSGEVAPAAAPEEEATSNGQVESACATDSATGEQRDAVGEQELGASSVTEGALGNSSEANKESLAVADGKKKKKKRKRSRSRKAPAIPLVPDVEGGHLLHNAWCLWYHKKQSDVEYKDALVKLATFNTIERFWDVYAHVARPADMSKDSDYFIFREGHTPMWEQYPNGGSWSFPLPKKSVGLGRAWEELIFAALGERFGEPDVIGIALSIRAKEDAVAVWTRGTARRFFVSEVFQAILAEIQGLDGDSGENGRKERTLVFKSNNSCIKDKSTYRNGIRYAVS